MENYFQLMSSTNTYSVLFNGVEYEVQTSDAEQAEEISGIYRADGYEMSQYEREGIRDYVYENILV
tara:strand:- start:429 stop:626 length:198 start_codon:yes stop_codon:yes gene_type:complete